MDLCHCGRELRLMNEASDDPKCPGCGLLAEACTCMRDQASGMELPN